MATETRLDRVEGELAEGDGAAAARRTRGGGGAGGPGAGPAAVLGAAGAGCRRGLGRVSLPPVREQHRAGLSALDFEAALRRPASLPGSAAWRCSSPPSSSVGMAISRGWINEEARTIIGGAVGSLALLFRRPLAARAPRPHRGRPRGRRRRGVSGLFGTIVVATQLYDLIPAGAWPCPRRRRRRRPASRSRCAGDAPVDRRGRLARRPRRAGDGRGHGTDLDRLRPPGPGGDRGDHGLAPLGLARARRLRDLSAASSGRDHRPEISFEGDPGGGLGLGSSLPLLVAVWALYTVAAVGYQLRSRTPLALSASSWFLLLASCTLVVGLGYSELPLGGGRERRDHLAVRLRRRLPRAGRPRIPLPHPP